MKGRAQARRLAKALLGVAVEKDAAERVSADLSSALTVFKAAPELYKILLNPMYKLDERTSLMDGVAGRLGLQKEVSAFLSVLIMTRTVKLLPDVIAAYERLSDERAGRLRALVESPVALTEAHVSEVRERLKGLTGKEVVVTFRENSAILAGLVVRIGNTVIDGSLRTQLGIMKEKILEGVA